MSEPAGDQRMHLADLLRTAVAQRSDRGAPWLQENAVDPATGEPVMGKVTANDLLRGERVGWVSPHRIAAIAKALGMPESAIYVANAISVGLAPPASGEFISMLPSWMDKLPPSVQVHLHQEITLFGRAHGLID